MVAVLTHDQVLGYAILAPICTLGLWVAWRCRLSPAARAAGPSRRLYHWDVPVYAFFMAVIRVVGICYGGMLAGQAIMKEYWPKISLTSGFGVVISGAIFQISALIGIGVAVYLLASPRIRFAPEGSLVESPLDPIPWKRVPAAGFATYAVLLPVMLAVTAFWPWLLKCFSVPVVEQTLVTTFSETTSGIELAMMGVMAVIVAPIVEETVFRGGLFRFLRRRGPRWAALLVPAVLFALLHGNLAAFPSLMVLSLIFAWAYEHTGRLSVTMIAHGLFNLTTLLFLWAKIKL